MFTLGLSLTNYEKTSRANDSELARNSKNGRTAMMRLKVATAGNGLHPNEAVVIVRTTSGAERLVVPRQSIFNNSIEIGWPIRTRDDSFLVELPRETQSGAWRVWVPKDEVIIPTEERMRA
jgi:hypothetical protein